MNRTAAVHLKGKWKYLNQVLCLVFRELCATSVDKRVISQEAPRKKPLNQDVPKGISKGKNMYM